jgi:hypothetical protein
MENYYNNLIKNEADSHKVVDDYISKLRDLLSQLAFLRNKLKSFLFNGKQLRFKNAYPDHPEYCPLNYGRYNPDDDDDNFINFSRNKKNDFGKLFVDNDGCLDDSCMLSVTFGKLFEADLNDFFGNSFEIENLTNIFSLDRGYGFEYELTVPKYRCLSINFLANGDLFMHGCSDRGYCERMDNIDEDGDENVKLELRIIDIKMMKYKYEKTIEVKNDDSSTTTSSNKICLQYVDLDGSQSFLVLDDSLNTLFQMKEENKKIIGSNEECIFLAFKDFKIYEKNPSILIYNWSLQLLNEIGQRSYPEKPFYFPIDLENNTNETLEVFNEKRKLLAKYGRYYYLTTVNKINELRIIDQETGKTFQICKNLKNFLIDSNYNLILIGFESIRYLSFSFKEIKTIKLNLNENENSLNWFLDKNNNLNCYTEEIMDAGFERDPTLFILHLSTSTTDY